MQTLETFLPYILAEFVELLPIGFDGVVHRHQEHLGVHQSEAKDDLKYPTAKTMKKNDRQWGGGGASQAARTRGCMKRSRRLKTRYTKLVTKEG